MNKESEKDAAESKVKETKDGEKARGGQEGEGKEIDII